MSNNQVLVHWRSSRHEEEDHRPKLTAIYSSENKRPVKVWEALGGRHYCHYGWYPDGTLFKVEEKNRLHYMRVRGVDDTTGLAKFSQPFFTTKIGGR